MNNPEDCRDEFAELFCVGEQFQLLVLELYDEEPTGSFLRYVNEKWDAGILPLVVTADPDDLDRHGLSIPSEFVVDLFELSRIPGRCQQLLKAYPQGLSRQCLRSMVAGALRRLLCRDDGNHGEGEMDPFDLVTAGSPAKWTSRGGEPWIHRIDKKLEDTAAYEKLFKNELKRMRQVVGSLKKEIEFPSEDSPPSREQLAQWARDLDEAYPRRDGTDLQITLPFAKATVLLIDDEAKVTAEKLERARSPQVWNPGEVPLGERYHMIGLELRSAHLRKKSGSLGKAFDRILRQRLAGPLAFLKPDLILLDLSLGEPPGMEPLGYQLLPLLRRYFPLIPIVVHTKYRDMGHIERAFQRGASWFLSKSESWKLPAHHAELVHQPNWTREWCTIKESARWDGDLDLDEVARYLITKSVENLPGSTIRVKALQGGIGGAKTLKIERKINGSFDNATPMVVKIDHRFPMLLERERYRRFIQPYVSNLAGRIDGPLQMGGDCLGAIAYTYAGTSQGRSSIPEIVTLQDLLTRNLYFSHQEIFGYSYYAPLFDCLMERILAPLHRIQPDKEPFECDFPNPVFGESPARRGERGGSALESYLFRMPAEHEIEIEEELPPNPDQSQDALVYEIEKGNPSYLKALMEGKDKLWRRVDLKGSLGSFYTDFRHLRPMQPLPVSKKAVRRPVFEDRWRLLWETNHNGRRWSLAESSSGEDDVPDFSFPAAGMEAETLPARIQNLIDWLTEAGGRPRRSLDQGRIGIVHGDMNLGNVMVESEVGAPPCPSSDTPWLIDFARTRRDRIVSDYTQFEVDLCLRLTRPEFFQGLAKPGGQDWSVADGIILKFREVPRKQVKGLAEDARLKMVYDLMLRVKSAALKAGVDWNEYFYSRIFQCLISHKINCGKWRKKPDDRNLQFRCMWSLRQALLLQSIMNRST